MKSQRSTQTAHASTDSSSVAPRPRLVKASEFAAREASRAEAVAPQATPPRLRVALQRAPRNETEARDMFSDLFKAA